MKAGLRKRLRKGFTLTELALVTALVSAVPASSYVRVKRKALQTKCVSNLRSIGQAIQMYKMENGRYPKAAFYPKNPAKDADSIRVVLADQGAGDKRLWICPSLPDQLAKKGLTFVYNDAVGGKTRVDKPGSTWLLIEFNCVTHKAPFPHPDGYNILYADGSVKTTKKLPKEIADSRKAWIRSHSHKHEAYAGSD